MTCCSSFLFLIKYQAVPPTAIATRTIIKIFKTERPDVSEGGPWGQGSYSPLQILPTSPITIYDFKYLINGFTGQSPLIHIPPTFIDWLLNFHVTNTSPALSLKSSINMFEPSFGPYQTSWSIPVINPEIVPPCANSNTSLSSHSTQRSQCTNFPSIRSIKYWKNVVECSFAKYRSCPWGSLISWYFLAINSQINLIESSDSNSFGVQPSR